MFCKVPRSVYHKLYYAFFVENLWAFISINTIFIGMVIPEADVHSFAQFLIALVRTINIYAR